MTFTPEQTAMLKAPLNKAHVKPPAPGKHGDYIEGWRVIDEANRIFGFDAWDRETVLMQETNRELLTLTNNKGEEYQQWRVGYVARVRIVVTSGGDEIAREGTGFGSGQGKPEALSDVIESAVKEAETDAMKRALMTFGNPFGLALYDKTKANVAVIAAPTLSDDQRDEIATLASAANVTLQAICKRYGVASLKDIPADAFGDIKEGLNITRAERAKATA